LWEDLQEWGITCGLGAMPSKKCSRERKRRRLRSVGERRQVAIVAKKKGGGRRKKLRSQAEERIPATLSRNPPTDPERTKKKMGGRGGERR